MLKLSSPYSIPNLEVICELLYTCFDESRDSDFLLLSCTAPQLPVFVYEFSFKKPFSLTSASDLLKLLTCFSW